MRFTRGLLPIGLCVMLGGCTHTYTLTPRTYSQINTRAELRTAEITFAGGESETAESLTLGPDSTSWLDPRTGRLHSVPTATVGSVAFRERGQGFVEGLALGGGIGLAFGTAVGAVAYRADDWESGWARLLTTSLACLAGGSIGVLVGVGKGTTNVYRARPAESPD